MTCVVFKELVYIQQTSKKVHEVNQSILILRELSSTNNE